MSSVENGIFKKQFSLLVTLLLDQLSQSLLDNIRRKAVNQVLCRIAATSFSFKLRLIHTQSLASSLNKTSFGFNLALAMKGGRGQRQTSSFDVGFESDETLQELLEQKKFISSLAYLQIYLGQAYFYDPHSHPNGFNRGYQCSLILAPANSGCRSPPHCSLMTATSPF